MNKRLSSLATAVAASAVLAGALSVILFGLAGVGRRGAVAFHDVRYWFLSTKLWLAGGNPYNHPEFSEQAVQAGISKVDHFAYPPTSFWLGLPLQIFSVPATSIAWIVINVMALCAIAAGSVQLLRQLRPGLRWDLQGSAVQLTVIAIVVGTPFATHVVWTGQTTLVITALLLWSWICIYRGSPWVGGFLFALGAIKPQLAVFLGLWLLIDRQWRALAAAAVTSVVLAAVPVWASGVNAFTDWLSAMTLYMNDGPQLALTGNLNFQSLVIGSGMAPKGTAVTVAVLAVGALAYAALWINYRRHRLSWVIPFALLVPMSLLFLFGRYYDLAACVGVVALGAHLSFNNPRRQVLLLIALLVICIPQRLFFMIGIEWLHYWRQVVLSVVIALEMAWALRMYGSTRDALPEKGTVRR